MLYFEARKHKDLYLWAAKSPAGPSVKFHVTNGAGGAAYGIQTMSCLGGGAARQPTCQAPHQKRCEGRCKATFHLASVLRLIKSQRLKSQHMPPAVHTLEELKLSGNHLKGSRPVLSFDK